MIRVLFPDPDGTFFLLPDPVGQKSYDGRKRQETKTIFPIAEEDRKQRHFFMMSELDCYNGRRRTDTDNEGMIATYDKKYSCCYDGRRR